MGRMGSGGLDERQLYRFPGTHESGCNVEYRPVTPLRQEYRRGSTLSQQAGVARSGREYLPHAAQRAKLRVYGGRSLFVGYDGCAVHPRRAAERRGYLRQALCAEQSGGRTSRGKRQPQRPRSLRDLSAGLQSRCARRSVMEHNGRVQPYLGTVRLPQPPSARGYSSRRVGIRRSGYLRLGWREQYR